MTFSRLAVFAAFCASLVAALPTPDTGVHSFIRRDATAASIVGSVMPKSLSCANVDYPDQCATNVQAAPYFISAMAKWGITTAPEIAAVLALVAVESGELRYRHSEFPKVAGKGTSNMQSPAYNAEYAAAIPELASGVAAANGDPDAVLALLTVDDYNFGSGAWFLSSQCASIRSQLQTNTDDGFIAYMGCVGATMTSERLDYWHTAQKAFGL
ncbi:uncharacterized protein SPSK_03636 [Sporothrix schenckii 1099-18]|uniref:Uncharacterized protein n=1 Tax=Sporothrix schenckii 1099-18 TaxID=1397361 RepID=A0A0F2LYA4_SPOSC|nr:uncharacterized protein SPSK_03636 [Sporothrix schenckii 1099-18]KJR82432.1 hypothetical protein SPSK_03636 [Sporothrix schenckii 1099-18]